MTGIMVLYGRISVFKSEMYEIVVIRYMTEIRSYLQK